MNLGSIHLQSHNNYHYANLPYFIVIINSIYYIVKYILLNKEKLLKMSNFYYKYPEHQSDPSVGQSHILAGKCDRVTDELCK